MTHVKVVGPEVLAKECASVQRPADIVPIRQIFDARRHHGHGKEAVAGLLSYRRVRTVTNPGAPVTGIRLHANASKYTL